MWRTSSLFRGPWQTTISRNRAYNAELDLYTRNRKMLEEVCQGPLKSEDVAYIRILDHRGQELVSLNAVPGIARRCRPGCG